ncbi:uncharacterized protein LOC110918967 [Helianthus annuus]|uniref:uncharacterized protein LOC110918967 n=1 Tax=Helianthus annuus TaxID=4232 RepID=UPI000B8EEC34|nr:uncharacterized protein LOC110918967 [Helianthus annuus]
MGLIKNWKPIVKRFEEKLTSWKARTLSFGGRLTLIEAVLVVAPKNKGGLGVGSLAASNKALMIKWLVRFKNEPASLWARSITAIHGDSRCHSYIPLKSSIGGVWKSIVNLGRKSQIQSINAGNSTLREMFPDLYELESDKRCFVSDRYIMNHESIDWFWGSGNPLSNANNIEEWAACLSILQNVVINRDSDVWLWKSSEKVADFAVSAVRNELDYIDTIKETKVLCWLHWIPKKVNCFLWRVVLDRIATREALMIRRFHLPSNQCILCNNTLESADHLLVSCETAKQVWLIIFQWMKLPIPSYMISVVQVLEIINSYKSQKNTKRAIYAVVAATCWNLWKMRNEIIFKQKAFSVAKLIGDIKAISFTWIKNRADLGELNWEKWRSFKI